MRKQLTDSFNPVTTASSAAEGAFMPDGSFKLDGGWAHQGPVHALVASLVRKRQGGGLTPTEASEIIANANGYSAFPHSSQWSSCDSWLAVWAGTSAETVVKYSGAGYKASMEAP